LRYDDCYCTVPQLQSEKLLASDLQIRLLENAITIGLTYWESTHPDILKHPRDPVSFLCFELY
jgi:hypothetical protein